MVRTTPKRSNSEWLKLPAATASNEHGAVQLPVIGQRSLRCGGNQAPTCLLRSEPREPCYGPQINERRRRRRRPHRCAVADRICACARGWRRWRGRWRSRCGSSRRPKLLLSPDNRSAASHGTTNGSRRSRATRSISHGPGQANGKWRWYEDRSGEAMQHGRSRDGRNDDLRWDPE